MKLKIILPLICILSASSMLGCNGKEESAYYQGVAAVENGDYATAETLFDQVVSSGQNVKLAYRGEGIAYLADGNYVKAIDLLTNALHESNGLIENADIDTAYYLAVAQYKAGQIDEAVKTLDSIVAIRPSSDTAFYLRGKIKLLKNDKVGAMADYDKVVELLPDNYEHYIRICEDLREAGFKDEGNNYINKAISLGGKMSDGVRGQLEYYQGNFTQARNSLENAKKGKDSETVTLFLGRTYEALGDVDYAINIYQEAINSYPTSGRLYNQLASTKMSQGDYQGAIDVIEQGIENGNGDSLQNLMYTRIVAYEYLCDFKTATGYMEEYINQYPGDASAEREYIFLKSR